jgi:hydroxymethylpyrimidine/phosphomethylpyrimidine kinase
MKAAADKLMALGPQSVLVTGGHLEGSEVLDVLCSAESLEIMSAPRIDTMSSHGTGCTLSSAIATFLAQKFELREAVNMARDFVREAMRNASGFGQGNGPLNHQYADQIEDIH